MSSAPVPRYIRRKFRQAYQPDPVTRRVRKARARIEKILKAVRA